MENSLIKCQEEEIREDLPEYRLNNFYESYTVRGGKLEKKVFKAIIQTHLKLVLDSLLEGNSYNFHYSIGRLNIYRMDRNFKKLMPNWFESNKLKQKFLDEGKELYNKETGKGEQWLVYFTDPYFYGLIWRKIRINKVEILKNATLYSFEPFAAMKRKITKVIKSDEDAILRFTHMDSLTTLLKKGKLKKAV